MQYSIKIIGQFVLKTYIPVSQNKLIPKRRKHEEKYIINFYISITCTISIC